MLSCSYFSDKVKFISNSSSKSLSDLIRSVKSTFGEAINSERFLEKFLIVDESKTSNKNLS